MMAKQPTFYPVTALHNLSRASNALGEVGDKLFDLVTLLTVGEIGPEPWGHANSHAADVVERVAIAAKEAEAAIWARVCTVIPDHHKNYLAACSYYAPVEIKKGDA